MLDHGCPKKSKDSMPKKHDAKKGGEEREGKPCLKKREREKGMIQERESMP